MKNGIATFVSLVAVATTSVAFGDIIDVDTLLTNTPIGLAKVW